MNKAIKRYTYEMTIQGIRVHGSTPWLGADSIIAAAETIRFIKAQMPAIAQGNVTFNSINGGDSVNVMAENCTIRVGLSGSFLTAAKAEELLSGALADGLREAPGTTGTLELIR
ncbi:peptidase dimerization domain-containing protein [Acetobacterium tundrae]|nr:peptidase dimerization domain-containing protein [Acetobacterium tundrae]